MSSVDYVQQFTSDSIKYLSKEETIANFVRMVEIMGYPKPELRHSGQLVYTQEMLKKFSKASKTADEYLIYTSKDKLFIIALMTSFAAHKFKPCELIPYMGYEEYFKPSKRPNVHILTNITIDEKNLDTYMRSNRAFNGHLFQPEYPIIYTITSLYTLQPLIYGLYNGTLITCDYKLIPGDKFAIYADEKISISKLPITDKICQIFFPTPGDVLSYKSRLEDKALIPKTDYKEIVDASALYIFKPVLQ